MSYAIGLGLTQQMILAEWEKFRIHHRSEETLKKSWMGTWQVWCRNGLEYRQGRTRGPGKSSTYDLTAQALWGLSCEHS